MKKRLVIGLFIYLALVGVGIVAYFGIQVARHGYDATVGGGGTNIWQTEETQTSQPGSTGTQSTQPGQQTAGPGNQLSQVQNPGQDSTATALQQQGLTPDTASLLNPSGLPKDTLAKIPGTGIKSPVNKTDGIDIKPQIDLSGGGLSSGGLNLKPGGTDLGTGLPSGGTSLKPGQDLSNVDLSGGSSGKGSGSSSSSSSSGEVLKLEKELESVYRNDHDLSATISKAQQILKMDPENAKAKLYTKMVKAEQKALKYEDSGESDKALAEWQKILNWDPGNRWAKKGVERNQ